MYYILSTIIGLGISLLIYHLLLKPSKILTFNRYYLLITILLLLFSPLLQIDATIQSPVLQELSLDKLISGKNAMEENIQSVTVETLNKTPSLGLIEYFLWPFYIAISFLFMLRFAQNIIRMIKLLKREKQKVGTLHLVLLDEDASPYSFFNFLFMSRKQYQDKNLSDSILNHETIHSAQLHSVDVLLIEFILCFFWFNPFVWKYKKSIIENHEFLADNEVINKGVDTNDYSNELIKSILAQSPNRLASSFSYLQTKNRIIMLNKTKSNRIVQSIKVFGAILIVGTLMSLNSISSHNEMKPLVVVIDLAHGGVDDGASNDYIIEKEIALKIGKKLKGLNINKNIKLLFTRTEDVTMNFPSRTDFINKNNPDLLISLHLNDSKNANQQGVEANYFDGTFQGKSKTYSKILISEQLKSIFNQGTIKTAPYIILKNTNCPGVLLTLGYISNEAERNLLLDSKTQDKIASAIYTGLIEIQKQM